MTIRTDINNEYGDLELSDKVLGIRIYASLYTKLMNYIPTKKRVPLLRKWIVEGAKKDLGFSVEN